MGAGRNAKMMLPPLAIERTLELELISAYARIINTLTSKNNTAEEQEQILLVLQRIRNALRKQFALRR